MPDWEKRKARLERSNEQTRKPEMSEARSPPTGPEGGRLPEGLRVEQGAFLAAWPAMIVRAIIWSGKM